MAHTVTLTDRQERDMGRIVAAAAISTSQLDGKSDPAVVVAASVIDSAIEWMAQLVSPSADWTSAVDEISPIVSDLAAEAAFMSQEEMDEYGQEIFDIIVGR